MKQVLLYLPVVHAGHEAFFARHADAAEVLLLGAGFESAFKRLAKDIRALPPERAAQFLRRHAARHPVRVIEPGDLPAAVTGDTLVLPDEDVTRHLADEQRLGAGRNLLFDRTFLRWDRDWSQARAPAAASTARSRPATCPGTCWPGPGSWPGHSSDWWRQVGAIAWRGGRILGRRVEPPLPDRVRPLHRRGPAGRLQPRRAGRPVHRHPRRGVRRRPGRARGVPLDGADLYVTTFPCPACARLIAESGFRRCYFADPYSLLDGDTVLRAAGVELLWVDVDDPDAR